jgi:hypothetical protein
VPADVLGVAGQQLLRQLARATVVAAQVGQRDARRQHVGRAGLEALGRVEQPPRLVELAAAHADLRVLAEELRVVGLLRERGEDRRLGLLELAELLGGEREQEQQLGRVRVVVERVARGVGGVGVALRPVERVAAQAARAARGRGLGVEPPQRLQRPLGLADLDVALRGGEGLVAHHASARLKAMAVSTMPSVRQAAKPGPHSES